MTTYTEILPNGHTFQMCLIEGGSFNMGSYVTAPETFSSEKPQRIDVIIATFYLAPYLVTQALWKAVMGVDNNPSNSQGEQHPVETVSWIGAQEFLLKLNEQTAKNRQTQGLGDYRLPTEAEWEFAASGGLRSGGYKFAGSDKLKEVGWYLGRVNGQTNEVGLLMANELGLYDLSGNVWEWVEDDWHINYHGSPKDGRAWLLEGDKRSEYRVLRGGGCFDVAQYCRVVHRHYDSMDYQSEYIGFRIALSPLL